MDNLLAGKRTSLFREGRSPDDVQRRSPRFRAHAEHDSGAGPKLFAFSPESLFDFPPESRSPSPRIRVRFHPGILFALGRIPQQARPAVDREKEELYRQIGQMKVEMDFLKKTIGQLD
jgi:hypothetical protein